MPGDKGSPSHDSNEYCIYQCPNKRQQRHVGPGPLLVGRQGSGRGAPWDATPPDSRLAAGPARVALGPAPRSMVHQLSRAAALQPNTTVVAACRSARAGSLAAAELRTSICQLSSRAEAITRVGRKTANMRDGLMLCQALMPSALDGVRVQERQPCMHVEAIRRKVEARSGKPA